MCWGILSGDEVGGEPGHILSGVHSRGRSISAAPCCTERLLGYACAQVSPTNYLQRPPSRRSYLLGGRRSEQEFTYVRLQACVREAILRFGCFRCGDRRDGVGGARA